MEELLKEVAATIHYLTTARGAHLETCTCALCSRGKALERAYQEAAVEIAFRRAGHG